MCRDHQYKKTVIYSFLAILSTFIFLLPILFRSSFANPIGSEYHNIFKVLLISVPVFTVLICYQTKVELPSKKISLFILLILISLLLVDIHYIYIDSPYSRIFDHISNHQWQVETHKDVLALSPKVLPHSYRFLPDSLVRLFELLTGDFSYARAVYRVTFMFLLLFSIYYYGRLYYNHETALLSVLFYAMIYPISIRFYAGQLTDPISHLLFVWSFIFLQLDCFIYFTLAMLIGVLAKESILVMAVYYILIQMKDKKRWAKGGMLLAASGLMIFMIRMTVTSNDLTYRNISGVDISHIQENLEALDLWGRQVSYTIGIFLPFLVLAWRTTRRELKHLVMFLLPILLLSNTTFGWLYETRNLIPVAIPMAIISSDYLMNQYSNKKIKGIRQPSVGIIFSNTLCLPVILTFHNTLSLRLVGEGLTTTFGRGRQCLAGMSPHGGVD